MQLDIHNERVKQADKLPWKAWESQYAALFSSIKGNVAKPCRMVFGSLIIQLRVGFTDRDLVNQIQQNPYFQYFIGLKEFQHHSPFAPTLLVEWRKRISVDFIIGANDILSATAHPDRKSFGLKTSCTLVATQICDATAAPQNIRFPQDTSLLNECSEKLEAMIDLLCETYSLVKPRT